MRGCSRRFGQDGGEEAPRKRAGAWSSREGGPVARRVEGGPWPRRRNQRVGSIHVTSLVSPPNQRAGAGGDAGAPPGTRVGQSMKPGCGGAQGGPPSPQRPPPSPGHQHRFLRFPAAPNPSSLEGLLEMSARQHHSLPP